MKTQITQLTEKVAALTVKQSSNKRCFYCNQLGHTKRSCPTCLTNTGAIDQGTMLGTAGRETTKGCLSGAAGIPHISKPQQHCYCSYGCTIKPHAPSVVGKVGGVSTEIMLDSGSSVSLLSQETAIQLTGVKQQPLPQMQLQTASGKSLPIKDYVIVDVQLDMMSTSICHNFLIVISLIAPVILGTDFFQQHGLILDFTKPTIYIYPKQDDIPVDIQNIWNTVAQQKPHIKMIAAIRESSTDVTTDYAIPDYGALQQHELPEYRSALFSKVITQYKELFCTVPGHMPAAAHHIPTKGSPICVLPRRVPAHYRNKAERQIDQMLKQGIITESSSPWMAPAVFIPNKSGELLICIDYRQKQTVCNVYPLPLPDEVQDHLAGSSVYHS